MAFSNTIDENVWADLMSKTSAGQAKAGAIQQRGVQTKPKKVKNFKQRDKYQNFNDGNLVRAKFKAPIRDAVKDLINFWPHKTGSTNCALLDASIAKGNSLLSLHASDKKAFNDKVESVWVSPVSRDAKITNQRGNYAAQMMEQYTNELQRKSDANCQVSGDKALDYAQQGLDSAYEGLGAPQGGQTGGGYGVGYAPPAQAGIGGNGMIFLALGAVAFAVIMFVKAKQPAQPMAVAPAPTPPAV